MYEKGPFWIRLKKYVYEFGEKVEGLEGVGVKSIEFLEKMVSTASGVHHKHILNLRE